MSRTSGKVSFIIIEETVDLKKLDKPEKKLQECVASTMNSYERLTRYAGKTSVLNLFYVLFSREKNRKKNILFVIRHVIFFLQFLMLFLIQST